MPDEASYTAGCSQLGRSCSVQSRAPRGPKFIALRSTHMHRIVSPTGAAGGVATAADMLGRVLFRRPGALVASLGAPRPAAAACAVLTAHVAHTEPPGVAAAARQQARRCLLLLLLLVLLPVLPVCSSACG